MVNGKSKRKGTRKAGAGAKPTKQTPAAKKSRGHTEAPKIKRYDERALVREVRLLHPDADEHSICAKLIKMFSVATLMAPARGVDVQVFKIAKAKHASKLTQAEQKWLAILRRRYTNRKNSHATKMKVKSVLDDALATITMLRQTIAAKDAELDRASAAAAGWRARYDKVVAEPRVDQIVAAQAGGGDAEATDDDLKATPPSMPPLSRTSALEDATDTSATMCGGPLDPLTPAIHVGLPTTADFRSAAGTVGYGGWGAHATYTAHAVYNAHALLLS